MDTEAHPEPGLARRDPAAKLARTGPGGPRRGRRPREYGRPARRAATTPPGSPSAHSSFPGPGTVRELRREPVRDRARGASGCAPAVPRSPSEEPPGPVLREAQEGTWPTGRLGGRRPRAPRHRCPLFLRSGKSRGNCRLQRISRISWISTSSNRRVENNWIADLISSIWVWLDGGDAARFMSTPRMAPREGLIRLPRCRAPP